MLESGAGARRAKRQRATLAGAAAGLGVGSAAGAGGGAGGAAAAAGAAGGQGPASTAAGAGLNTCKNVTVFLPDRSGRSGYVTRAYPKLTSNQLQQKLHRERHYRVLPVDEQPPQLLRLEDCGDRAQYVEDVELRDGMRLAVVVDEGARTLGEQQQQEDGDPYAVPYGAYGDEARGRGNPALAAATARERAAWRRLFDPAGRRDEVMLAFAPNPATDIKLPREKLLCLASGEWLNSDVINLYMLLLQDRDSRLRSPGGSPGPRGTPRCHFFGSFFYNKLFSEINTYNYANVRRWTIPNRLRLHLQASPDVLELDRIIIPIHKGDHWTCAVIDLRAQAASYYDSLMGEDRACLEHLLRWLADESEDKLKKRWDTSKWRREFPKSIPQQRNGCDCGVSSLMFADRLGSGAALDFSQADMELLRVQVAHRLMSLRVD